jgi:hypothetical protein
MLNKIQRMYNINKCRCRFILGGGDLSIVALFFALVGRAHARMIKDWQRPPSGPIAHQLEHVGLIFLPHLEESMPACRIKDWQRPAADPMVPQLEYCCT